MMEKLPQHFVLSKTVARARQYGHPLVALESAVITHGLPYPQNREIALAMEAAVRESGANPATIALLNGNVCVGLEEDQVESLATSEIVRKISLRDFGIAIARGLSGGTTVAATLFAAEQTGIRVFATGGIGGVHRGSAFDVSADLVQLGKSQVVVVCAGAKAILDLPATLEVLETQGVPVIGLGTDEFPAFYSSKSGLKVDYRVESPQEAAEIAQNAWATGLKSAVLLVVPLPENDALPPEVMENAIQRALAEAEENHIHGAATTPFLLSRVSEITGGASLRANLSLLLQNARVAGQVAAAMHGARKIVSV